MTDLLRRYRRPARRPWPGRAVLAPAGAVVAVALAVALAPGSAAAQMIIRGGEGNDSYRLDGTGGQMAIIVETGADPGDTLRLENVALADLSFEKRGRDLIIRHRRSGAAVARLNAHFERSSGRVDRLVTGADGQSWDLSRFRRR